MLSFKRWLEDCGEVRYDDLDLDVNDKYRASDKYVPMKMKKDNNGSNISRSTSKHERRRRSGR